jgi:hypothetical protein
LLGICASIGWKANPKVTKMGTSNHFMGRENTHNALSHDSIAPSIVKNKMKSPLTFQIK